jgi:hypothetical protein
MSAARRLMFCTALIAAAGLAQGAPAGAQSAPAGAQSAPTGAQSAPTGAQSAPTGSDSADSRPVAGFELAAQSSVKVARAVRVEQEPRMDGNVLGDPVWAAAQPVGGFRQSFPDEGLPATERTEVRVLFTSDTIYFGVICYDSDPAAIIMSDSRRDSSMTDADSFQMVLDTFQDQQNGFIFGTTPAGQEYDGQVINEGGSRGSSRRSSGSGGFSRGSAGGFNLNWDGAWQVQTAISDIGWSAEFAIPFRTVRYPAREFQSWGVNFQRNIRRRSEISYWSPLPRQYNLYRVSMAGQLAGLATPAGLANNLQMTPYAIGETGVRRSAEGGASTMRGDYAYGADLKYSINSGLTLDGTFNTDFAQVEVDDQQINLDRFNLFFPEKRPFFLENAGIFTVNNQSASGRRLGQTELFFSRRIGISDAGTQIPIQAGARLSGKVTDDLTVGVINMQTEGIAGVAGANNFSVTRVRRDLPNRSSIGGLFVNRQGTGQLSRADDYNRTYAVDGRWGIGQNGMVSGFYGGTQTPGLVGRDHALTLSGTYNSEMWRISSGYKENGEDFNPEVGFVARTGFRNYDLAVQNTSRPEGFLKFQELRPHMSYSHFWNFDGITETTYLHTHFQGEFEDSSSAGFAYDVRSENVFDTFSVSGLAIPPGRYDWAEMSSSVNYDRSAPVSAGVRAEFGGFFGGSIVTVRPSVRARIGEIFNLQLSYSRNDIDLPSGTTVTNLTSVRAGYNFSPRVFVQTLLQHNDSAQLWSMNFRLGWLQDANTGLFLVYNETEGILDYVPTGAGRSVIVKYSYLFDVLD